MSWMKSNAARRMLVAMGCAVVLAGCATMPAELNQPVSPLALNDVKAARAPVTGQNVRWGGVIAAVENRNSETWLEIVEQPLNDIGRPRMVDHSSGRFMVRAPGFLDPTIYAKGREFTAVGTLDGMYRSTIGKDYHYDYPVVASANYYLWPPRVETDTYYVDPMYPAWGPGYWGSYYRGWHGPYGPWYGPGWYGGGYRVDVRRPSGQPGPGPVPQASSGRPGANPPPLPSTPAVTPTPVPASEPEPVRNEPRPVRVREQNQEPDAPRTEVP